MAKRTRRRDTRRKKSKPSLRVSAPRRRRISGGTTNARKVHTANPPPGVPAIRKTPVMDSESELHCKYISSKGPQYACDVYNVAPTSEYSTVYCKPDAKGDVPFITTLLDSIDKPYILVVAQSDYSFPEVLGENSSKYIDTSKCIHIFAQNATIMHHKVTALPIGLDYHSQMEFDDAFGEPSASPKAQEKVLQEIKDGSAPFAKRKLMCYANFNSKADPGSKKFGYDRENAIKEIQKELIEYQEEKIPRSDTWRRQVQYAFVICPHGNGLDCHRQWEALCLGCIPIVVTSPIDVLYKDLPVLIVKKWSDITHQLLQDTVNKFKDTRFNYDKLLLSYWVDKINSYKKH